jgi:hypothetical protein
MKPTNLHEGGRLLIKLIPVTNGVLELNIGDICLTLIQSKCHY